MTEENSLNGVHKDCTDALCKGIKSLKICDSDSSNFCNVSNVLSSNYHQNDKMCLQSEVGISTNSNILCNSATTQSRPQFQETDVSGITSIVNLCATSNVNNLDMLNIYTRSDSEDDSESVGDQFDGGDQSANQITKNLVISNAVLIKGVKYLHFWSLISCY